MRNVEQEKAVAKLFKIGRMAMTVKEKGGDMTTTLARIDTATKALEARSAKRNENQ